MTMFIAGLLIYHFNMDWYWYGIAAALWAAKLFWMYLWDEEIKGAIRDCCRFQD